MRDPLAALRTLNASLAALDLRDADGLADAIALVYSAIASLADRELQDFERFSEADLADPDRVFASSLLDGKAVLPETDGLLLAASQLLRALEQATLQFESHQRGLGGPELEDAYRTSDGQHYVVPCVSLLGSCEGRPFLRRALLHTRVLPTEIEGFAVRLHALEAVADVASASALRKGGSRTYGAGLFPGLSVVTERSGDKQFLVTGLSGLKAEDCLTEQLAAARETSCVAVVWAELTMPEASVAFLQKNLAERALDDFSFREFFVAGSWHRAGAGGTQNLCAVLDGFGLPMFEVAKWAKFKLGDQVEAIVPGNEIHILIGEQELSVVAICRDFLQETKEVPYRRLHVDVAIVPSMTPDSEDKKTLEGHAATAHTMRVRYGTRTMVVAQPATPGSGPVGKILAFPAQPLSAMEGEAVEGPWHLCRLDFVNRS